MADNIAPQTLGAGRALDALVAEKVMGWRTLGPRWTAENRTGYEWVDAQGVRYQTLAFSKGIGEAWKVVEHMRQHAPTRFKNLSLVAYAYNRTYATFDAEAIGDYTPETWVEANGEHATEEAICRAALAALGGPHASA